MSIPKHVVWVSLISVSKIAIGVEVSRVAVILFLASDRPEGKNSETICEFAELLPILTKGFRVAVGRYYSFMI